MENLFTVFAVAFAGSFVLWMTVKAVRILTVIEISKKEK